MNKIIVFLASVLISTSLYAAGSDSSSSSSGGDSNENLVESDYKQACLLYTSPSPRDRYGSRMPSSA